MERDRFQENVLRAGEIFILSQWVQSQIVDLLILKQHPRIRGRFVKSVERVPRTLVVKRARYWQRDFGSIASEFEQEFPLSQAAVHDLHTLLAFRNALGHSYVSCARDYFLYRPSGKRGRKTRKLVKLWNVEKKKDSARPVLFKISFVEDARYLKAYYVITRMDQVHLSEAASYIGVPHGRIR